jgi:hypothetical protein
MARSHYNSGKASEMTKEAQTLNWLIQKGIVTKNREEEAKRVADIKAHALEAVRDSQGIQPCTVDSCSSRARYFSTLQNFCENHLLIQRSDIFKSGLVVSA